MVDTHYISDAARARAYLAREAQKTALLRALGEAVRARRSACGMTMRVLAERAQVSERFLSQLEQGDGNISVARLEEVAQALHTTAAALLAQASPAPAAARVGVIALLGLRGAGKSTIGRLAAERLGVPFVELDQLVAKQAGMTLSTIFELHGEAWFRRAEREALEDFLTATPDAVLATSGSIVMDPATYALLRERTKTVWLRAEPRDHWNRVVAQGDGRPMQDRADAMSELKALLRARKPLYAQAAEVVDTSAVPLEAAVEKVVSLAARPHARGGAGVNVKERGR